MNKKISIAQLKRDRKAVLSVLADGSSKSFAQISLQGGEDLWQAVNSLVQDNSIIYINGKYSKLACT